MVNSWMVSSVGMMENVSVAGFSHSAATLSIKVNEKKMVSRHEINVNEKLRRCMVSPFVFSYRLDVW